MVEANKYNYYPGLDGLRGIAILLVILYHNFNYIGYFNYGRLGVDLFFVLSGFLITSILLKTLQTKEYFKKFYARRTLRIFPLYYLSLILFIVILPQIQGFPLNVSIYKKNQIWFWLYLQNWALIFNHDSKSVVLNHFWSLAVEEQYYLVWPVIIFFIKSPQKVLIVTLIILISIIAIRIWIINDFKIFFEYNWLFLFTRIDGILTGSILALLHFTNYLSIRKFFIALTLFLLGVLILCSSNPIYHSLSWDIVGYSISASIFSLIVYEAVSQKNKYIRLICSNPLLRFFGKYSYGLYVFHWPVYLLSIPLMSSIAELWFRKGSKIQLTASALGATILGLIISVLSYELFEKHFLKLKKYF